ncbi:hypothetical protein BCR33DRAFT_154224 [Rhizoclosmatium globosum]|uniref:Mis12-domain-containing protein n=1 Tax=Rhizoclosmatium globosum TaxID=329046 RepID=A0A1Y2CG07_9FUNG|nr:hypothetical protein BCR33DRAFT_154224 [Rhizoclosmatium globosum]|eukprot:ORY45866.1 hypothetical protein BCR33DRAFT_154224 [Rhizoclosmatium globosum]
MHRRQTLSHNLRAIADLRKRRQSGIEGGGLVAETGFDSTLTATATSTATPRDFERELSDLIGASSGSAASNGGGGDPTATTGTSTTTTSTTTTSTTSTSSTTSTNAKKNLDALAFATAQSRRAKDIIVEHFGFAPQNLVDEAINIVNALLMQALEACEAFLLEQVDDDDVVGGGGRSDTVNNACLDDAAIEEGITSLTTLMENTVDKVFDRFDVFCKDKLMGIPPNTKVVLDRYKEIEDLKKELEEEEGMEHLSVEALELEVMELSKKVAAVSCFCCFVFVGEEE